MPGVTVLPNSPGLGGFGLPQPGKRMSILPPDRQQTRAAPATPNGAHSYDALNAAGIKEKAIEAVRRDTHGASPMSLLKTAKSQYNTGKLLENAGDLKSSLAAYVKAASLAKLAIDSPENKKGGLLWKEIGDFWKIHAGDLGDRLNTMEDRLKAFESAHPQSVDPPSQRSIADRVKALQESGLSVGSPKRIPRTLAELTPPSSPKHPFPRAATPPVSFVPSASASSTSSHTLVSPSTFGPPSPPSSPSDFAVTFPSIEDFDKIQASDLSSPPHIASNALQLNNVQSEGMPPASTGQALVAAAGMERPSSILGLTSTNPFSALSSTPPLPRKTSALSIQSPALSSQLSTKPIIPVSRTATSKELVNYLQVHKVLLIDVRDRADFEREHIQSGAAIICVEPLVLRRENLTLSVLENAMSTAPISDQSVFSNRDKFDIVVIYDEDSTILGLPDSPLAVLHRLIGEQSVQKLLKRQPMLLVGGLNAWRRELAGYTKPGTPNQPNVQVSVGPSSISRTTSRNPFYTIESSNYVPSSQPLPGSPFHPNVAVDQGFGHSRSPAEASYPTNLPSSNGALIRRPALTRPHSNSISYTRSTDNLASTSFTPNGYSSGPFTYPILSSQALSSPPGPTNSSSTHSPLHNIASLPQASINPSQLSRKRSDFIDQSQEAVSNLYTRGPIDYPVLPTQQVLQPPPPVASSSLTRQDNRTWTQNASPSVMAVPAINSSYPVTYWGDPSIEPRSMRNPGNICYMNANMQCLSVTFPLVQFFHDPQWERGINVGNTLGWGGTLVKAFYRLLLQTQTPGKSTIDATFFLDVVRVKHAQYVGDRQHDSQEFLSLILDVMHEELNRVLYKPPPEKLTHEEEERREGLSMREASDLAWRMWRRSNDSIIVDLFQGQFQNKLQCLHCHKTSTTYNVFSILQLPIRRRGSSVPLKDCLDHFFAPERLDGDNAWDCPRCKRKQIATKQMSLARLPPILLVHLKRFETIGSTSDKIDTSIDYPTKGLDLSSYIRTDPQQGCNPEDPRTQTPPYRYDLYGVTKHAGSLSSGHYVADVKIQGGWRECSDATIRSTPSPVQSEHLKAYVLFYKRTKT